MAPAKRALVIAAAARHTMLMLGPPGSGETEYLALRCAVPRSCRKHT